MVQTPFVKVEIFNFNEQMGFQKYATFSPYDNTNFISYSFTKNISNMAGDFSFTIKPNNAIDFNRINNLDLVKIFEGDNLVFLGVVTKTTQNSSLQGDTVVITGKEVCYLFELLFYSFDISVMCYLNENKRQDASNLSLKLNLNEKENNTTKSKLLSLYKEFKGLVNTSNQPRTYITDYIDALFNIDFLEIDSKVKFEYPIASNLFNNSDTNYIAFIKNLLPSPIYEIYGCIENTQPYIKIRQVPFDADDWEKLSRKNIVIDEEYLESYSFSKNCEEVYTVFYSYVENSLISAENSQKAEALSTNPYAVINQEKMNIYGCKPMKVSFVGYGYDKNAIETKEEKTNVQQSALSSLESFLKKQNAKLDKWFSKIDEMLLGNISLVNNWKESPKIGDVIKFKNKEFYVTSVEHSWSYGQRGKVNLKVDRGGLYSKGNWVGA